MLGPNDWRVKSRRKWREKLWRYRRNRDRHDKGSVRWRFWNRKAVKAKAMIEKRTKQIRAAHPYRTRRQVVIDSRWAGTQAIFEQLVRPMMQSRGLPVTSQKRSYDTVEPGVSDHYVGCKVCWAEDYGTYSGRDDAEFLADWLGIEGWQPNSYERYRVVFDDEAFSVQILWGAEIDHDDHVHVGIRRL